ncbi:MAG TPA: BadF/BadG/BcrA/BcrD ATPase family protein [Pararhizobium sp.]|uniref:N-acetylglucosamine kinase n=1 Tax=Pararhizobium sp. TaxID=1977563 RepID=UPI002CA20C5C|nr:BadF/BadG/BcrA/BcrD ATPase family protein [Pararhizobium sp.]HTO30988.1 BadF/BadG/BcrA/BcrD ATPase family protein [Pararhizobium sp.]
MSVVLGLDSGGTKTLAAIADQSGQLLRQWTGPGFDPMAGDQWVEHLRTVADVLGEGQSVAAVVLGLPLHGEVEAISERQRAVAASVFECPQLVLNDVEVACDGAFAGEDGVLVLAGTGSMAWAKVGGKSFRSGGWGDAFGDEGSAYWIGRQALSMATQALDGRRDAPEFAAAILAACGIEQGQLIAWAYGQDNARAGFADLARTVDALADADDATAIEILTEAARFLADLGLAARHTFGQPSLAWSHAGSVFRSRLIRDELERRLGPPAAPKLPPVGGALWRAAALAGWPANSRFTGSIAAGLENKQPKQENS